MSFYESMGFTRVGAVARYRDEQRRVHLEKGGGGDPAGRMNRKKRGYGYAPCPLPTLRALQMMHQGERGVC